MSEVPLYGFLSSTGLCVVRGIAKPSTVNLKSGPIEYTNEALYGVPLSASASLERMGKITLPLPGTSIQGYLAHNKAPTPLGPP